MLCDFFGVLELYPLFLQLLLFAVARLYGVDIADLIFQKLDGSFLFLSVAHKLGQPLFDVGMVGIERGKLRLFRLAVCESIEISHVIFFIEQRLIGVLSVDADEPFRKLPHDRQRHRASVDSGGGYAFIGDVPLEKQRSVLRLDAELRRKAGSLGPDRFKQCRNRRFSSPVRRSSRDARSPMMSPTESMMMDLPAPVSPVRTVRAAPGHTRSLLMIAILLMYSSFNTKLPPLYVLMVTVR